MRFIPTKVHAVLDYLTAITLLALPRLLNWDRDTTTFLTILAIATIIYSLLTRYEGGLMRVLPVKIHLLIDFLSGVGLASSPFWLFPNVENQTRLILMGLGVFEILASLLSKSHSPGEDVSSHNTTSSQAASAH